jgi:hypothetical protein
VLPSLSTSGRLANFLSRSDFLYLSTVVIHRRERFVLYSLSLIPVKIMVFRIARAAALLALLCPLATPLGIPSTGGGCTHGPTSRGCWNGDFNIDTDMDEHWPDTGKVVKVRLLNKYSTS